VTAVTLLLVGLGTNFFFYASYETGMSNPLNFFWFAVSTWAATRWLQNHRWTESLILGMAFGFIGLVRPTDLVFGIFIAILFLASVKTITPGAVRKRLMVQAMIAAIVALLLFSIQLFYWKWVSGHWLLDSYPGEHFDFTRPHIFDGLFSYKKGWYVYTPIALFATLGIVQLWLRDRLLAIAVITFFVINVYITFSWEMWWYGGGFGARSMLQTLALMAFPLAALVEWILRRWGRKPFVISLFIIVAALLIGLNLFQSYQYDETILHWENMDRNSYWKTFGKTHISQEEFKQLYGE
jgi:hypothetical protein